MIALKSDNHMSPEEYLEFESHSDIKHEYIDGQIYAMAGTTKAHNTISLNLTILFREKLKGSDCQTFMADIKVNISSNSLLYAFETNLKLKEDFRQLCQEEESFHKIIIDMSKTEFMDSSGIGALVSCLQVLRQTDIQSGKSEPTELVLWSVNPQVVSILKMTKLENIFRIEPATRTNRLSKSKNEQSPNRPHRLSVILYRIYQALINIPILCAIAYLIYFLYPAIELDPSLPVHPSVRSFPKRIIDILGALVGLSFTAILFVPIAIAIKLESQGAILFKQNRAGLLQFS
jgi:anti-anti-sigma factor